MGREDFEAGRAGGDEDREGVGRLGRLLTVGDGGLVAVMAVRDQQRRADWSSPASTRQIRVRTPPSATSARRLASPAVERRVAS